MAEQTTSSIVIAAPPARVMEVIADFPAYPTWAKGMRSTEVLSQTPDGRPATVRFALDVAPIRDEYVLAYDWHGDREVTWSLVESKILRTLDGAYELRERPDGSTEVTYRLELDLTIPLIGMLKRKGERILIDTALSGLKSAVERGR